MNELTEKISVEVAYALPAKQQILQIDVEVGTTAYDAVVQSEIVRQFSEIDIEKVKMGIFGKVVKPKAYQLQEGDRVEIYRPLLADPKAMRKARADKARSAPGK